MSTELKIILALDRDALVERWAKLFGCPPPAKCGEKMMRRVLGWHAQAKQTGGLTNKDLRLMFNKEMRATPPITLGTQLIRVWNGETHQVTVLEDGFSYGGSNWKSLSAIARKITGTPWSGPLFFGIKK